MYLAKKYWLLDTDERRWLGTADTRVSETFLADNRHLGKRHRCMYPLHYNYTLFTLTYQQLLHS